MRSRYYVTGTALLIGSVVVTLAVIVSPIMTGVQQRTTAALKKTTSTPYGPLSGADKEFVVKVRLAGLWEFPAGQLALKKGTTSAVKTAGRHLIQGHQQLDASARDIAPKLGITLPNQATPQQKGFLDTMAATSGGDFNNTFAEILRVTHGQIFSAIAKIRGTSRNSLVRQLATQANNVVLDHITQMENTGLLNYERVDAQITASPTYGPEFTTPPKPSPGEPTFIVTESPGAGGASPTPTP
jgi:predicted outer membrane protein